jgi:hypothetical protein
MSVIPLMHSPFSLLMYKKFLFVVKSTKNEHKIPGGLKIAFFLVLLFCIQAALFTGNRCWPALSDWILQCSF